MNNSIPDNSGLQEKLNFRFRNDDLLEKALRHSSFVNEQMNTDLKDNECLEFLGDAVLNLVVGHLLMDKFPDLKEGDLSRMRAGLVNESTLARIARSLDLGPYIRLGKGEIQTDGREKNSILADTFEAIVAAMYMDSGFIEVFKIVENQFDPLLNSITDPIGRRDYKSRLQEIVQTGGKGVPYYTTIDESGPDHDKTFLIELKVFNIRTEGSGKSKKVAEQNAAKKALEVLSEMLAEKDP